MSQLVRRAIVYLGICCGSVFAWVAAPAATLAQGRGGQQQGQQPHSDAIPYLLVLFCVVLGLIVLCRSAGRSTEMALDELEKD